MKTVCVLRYIHQVEQSRVRKGVKSLRLIIDQSLEYKEVEITIKCGLMDAHLENLISQIRLYSFSITGKKEGRSYIIRFEDVFYIESIDDKTFVYCKKEIFECELKLYELEHQLLATSFVRISKSCIINTTKVSNVRALLNGKFEAELTNKEKVIINRHYVQSFKQKFNT